MFDKKRFEELFLKLQRSPLNAEELKELGLLQAELSKKNEGRQDVIKQVVKLFEDNQLELTEVFTPKKIGKMLEAEGVKADKVFVTATNVPATPSAGVTAATTATTVERPSNDNEELIKSAGHGRRFIYKRGRVFEDVKGEPTTDLKKVYGASLSKFFTTHKTATAIIAAATEKGKEYFATEEGKEELDKLVELAQLA